MLHKDTSFIITIQLTLIGIVLVAGLYLLWKALGRIEEKVDLLLMDKQTHKMFNEDIYNLKTQNSTELSSELKDDEFMKSVFGGETLTENTNNSGFVFFGNNYNEQADSEDSHVQDAVMIEEISSKEPQDFSKSKLRQMNLDRLKELCIIKNLSTEGTKNQLIERLMAD